MRGFFSQQKRVQQSGFTLVEMLVYLAIFIVVSVASVSFLFSLKDFIGQYRLETMLYRSGTGAMEQILLAIRQAEQVDPLNTVEDDPVNGKLTVENTSTSTTFTLNAGALDMEMNGELIGNLAASGVTVDDFTVYFYPLSGGKEFVRVRLSLTGTVGAQSKGVTLYGGAVVRGAI